MKKYFFLKTSKWLKRMPHRLMMWAVMAAMAAMTAQAQVYTVTSTDDDDTEGALRWALIQSNAQSGGAVINVSPSLAGQTITLTVEMPRITKNVTINGNGIIISGDNARRIFNISEADVTFDRITFANGYESGIRTGGAIVNYFGNMTFTNCVFKDNAVNSSGGAIYSVHDNRTTTATFVNCLFTGNTASVAGGAVYYNDGDGDGITFVNCTFTDDNMATVMRGNIFYYDAGNAGAPPQFLNCIIANADNGNDFFWGSGSTINDVVFKNTLTNVASLGSNDASVYNKINVASLGLNADGAIAAGSPAIDAGDNSLFQNAAAATDLAGNQRIANSVIDIGAYEYGSTPHPITPPTVIFVEPSGTSAAISGVVVITFSEAMNTTPGGTVELASAMGLITLSNNGQWSVGNTVYTVDYSGLENNTMYNVNIAGFKDAAGNEMNAVTGGYTFTTVSSSQNVTSVPNVHELYPENTLRAWMRGGLLHITGLSVGETLSIYSANGALVHQSKPNGTEIDINLKVQEMYIVQSGGNTVRVVVQ